ncbi:PKD domain-containing protein [Ferruginibacter sp. SUN106]|uniref:gliding motility-associated C-terminal domain-containing protein n=1 Tax=Ferruginibacter sp. SUN106 TaxID=2978348 RepID=UPI003D362B4C
MTANSGVKYSLIIVLLVFFSFSTKAQLTANFTATPLAGCAPLVVSFTDQSTGSPTQWKWDLGNGTISFLQNPSVTYFNPGQYTIKLVVHDVNGDSNVIIKSQYITVNASPTVAFTGAPLTGCFPLPVNFTDQSSAGSGTISTWQWDFGDGASSNIQSPSHTYAGSGNYNVTLRLTNSFGCSKVLTKLQYVKISSGVHADFSNNIPSACNPPVTVNFQNLSTGTGILNYQWSFGDGGTATTANPSHIYNTAGVYTVRLITTNSGGCTDTITKTNLINIGTINAAFTSANSVCVNVPLVITNTSAPAPVAAAWDFGDATTSTQINPIKIYNTPGVYQIRLIADFGGCLDTAYKTVTVLSKPAAAFTAANTSACQAPLTVSFNNTSAGAATYNWDFGDGSTSTVRNPTHTYNSTGTFTVTLIITNANGCSDTLQKIDLVKILPPQVSINNLPVAACAPLTWTFSSTVNSVDPVVSYHWDFGDGNTSAAINPTHVFAAGVYDIQLIITTAGGCTDTATVIRGITASVKPVPNLVATPRDVCAHMPVNFTDLSTGTITNWLWIFGDGATSNEQNPTHTYEDTGYFNITLIVCNAGCCDSIKFLNYVHINPPIAAFDVDFLCKSKTRTFTDKSIGADEWNWNFGDGNTSTQQSPVHTFADTGTYTISLRVKNYTTGCEYTKTTSIRIIDERASFTASDSVICKNNVVNFTATGNNNANVASYEWSFGDGATGGNGSTSHTYTLAGKYTVQLIVTDIFNCKDTLIKPLYIQVDGPTAGFAPGVPGSCLLSAITFTDNSVPDGIHPLSTWIWSYGDGIIDTLTTPPFQHTYSGPGVYTVSLKVTDSKGCIDSIVHPSIITISKPVANFATVDTLSCPTKLITFSNTSTGPGLNYTWHFGDGTTSTSVNPTHSYAADGLYTIKLFITDQYGCSDSLIIPDYVRIVSPHSNFSMSDSLGTCPPLFVSFTNHSQNFTAVNWDFGDGTSTQSDNPSHFYNVPGIYFAKLTVTSPGGCTDVYQKKITVRGPLGNFTYGPTNGCKPLTVHFAATTQDRLSFIWDFNDGTTTSTLDSVMSHTYTIPGIYVPKMILVDPGGCVVPVLGPDTIVVNGVAANFGFINHNYCDAASISFSDSSMSNDVIASYAWDFGDGNTSALQNPTHFYSTPGLYYPQLIVTTQSGCADTLKNPAPVRIVASPQASIGSTGNGCAPLTVSFKGQLLVPDTSAIQWHWNFGNGITSIVQNPPLQIYATAGTYNAQLIAINSSGCADTITKTIDAFLVPIIDAGVDTLVCRGNSVSLTATGAASYTWTPATGLSCTNCAKPTARPDSATNYIVKGTTLQGCSNTDSVLVKVKQRFTMLNSLGDTLCKGSSVRLFASGGFSYVWSPSTGLSSTTSATPLATPQNTTTYKVIGTDDKACFRDTGFVTVKVYPIPTVEAGNDKTINVGQSVDLMPTISADVSAVTWTPTQSIVQNHYPGVTVKPRETTEYVVEARNAGGCKTRDRVTVFVICNGANVFIPNTFSPNGDGVNDIFYPRGTGLFSIKTLRIFNRWGEVVYEKNGFMPNDANAGWNGTVRGMKQNPDVFVYTIDILCDNSSVLTLKGNVALIQ